MRSSRGSGSCCAAYPTMPATVIAERIGWPYGLTVLKERVRELRPVYLPPDPASRTSVWAGEIAQCDFWFPDIELPVGFGQIAHGQAVAGVDDGVRLLAVVGRGADPDPARPRTCTLGWWQLLSELGAVPRVLVWDGEGAVGRWRRGRSRADRGSVRRSAATLGTQGA